MKKGTLVFLTALFICGILTGDIFASTGESKEIKKIEEKEKDRGPEPIVRPRMQYNAEGLKDPFQEPVIQVTTPDKGEKQIIEPEVTPPSLKVQGVIWGGRFPQAIINNKVVKVGDTIEGARVVSIEQAGIAVFFNGRQFNLSSPAAGAGPVKEQKRQ